jgi:hypothetical protein
VDGSSAVYGRAHEIRLANLDEGPLSSHLVRLMDAAVDIVPSLVLEVLEPDYAISE